VIQKSGAHQGILTYAKAKKALKKPIKIIKL